MKILLINPICYHDMDSFIKDRSRMKINADEPIGLMYIQAYIKKNLPEVSIKLYDWHFDSIGKSEHPQYLLFKAIDEYGPDVVGISALYEYNSSMALLAAQIARDYNKDIITIMGGIYASLLDVIPANVNYIIKGEGEAPFLQLIKQILNDQRLKAYQNKTLNYDELLPDRTDIKTGEYSIVGRTSADRFYKAGARVATIQTDRGCPFKCTYCSGHVITNRYYNKRSVDSIVNEIKDLKEKFDIEVFIFNSENAVVNKDYTKELYRALKPLKIKWYHNGGFYVHLMDQEIIDLAIDSGLIFFNLAIESGSKRMLRLLKKSESIIDNAIPVMEWIRDKSDIYVTAFFLSGFPFETQADIELSKELALSMDIDWLFWNLFQPFKGSELYDYCIEKGHIDLKPVNSAHYIDSKIKNSKLDMDLLVKEIYDFQLRYNFDKNRRIKIGDYDQARRDLVHVLNVTNWKHIKAKELLNDISNNTSKV